MNTPDMVDLTDNTEIPFVTLKRIVESCIKVHKKRKGLAILRKMKHNKHVFLDVEESSLLAEHDLLSYHIGYTWKFARHALSIVNMLFDNELNFVNPLNEKKDGKHYCDIQVTLLNEGLLV